MCDASSLRQTHTIVWAEEYVWMPAMARAGMRKDSKRNTKSGKYKKEESPVWANNEATSSSWGSAHIGEALRSGMAYHKKEEKGQEHPFDSRPELRILSPALRSHK